MKFSGLCLLCFIVTSLQAQNLVPNNSFEIYTSCPTGAAEVYKAPPWNDPTGASSDYLNECSSNANSSVPVNIAGAQWPRTGRAYGGIEVFVGPSLPDHREYLQVRLIDSLNTGKTYCVTFYVSKGGNTQMACNGLSAYFSVNPTACSGCFLPYTPQINYTGSPITDTVNWVPIQGTFVASGREQYMTVGNFNHDSNTIAQVTNPSSPNLGAYYYVDDVSVIPVTPIDAGHDGTICFHDSMQLGTAPVMEVYYSWSPAQGLSNPNSSNPKASPSATTTYTLTQTQCNVVSTSTVTVTVEECEIFVPNAFSPNHDGENDLLFVYSHKPLASLEFSIYDRWGEKVFETTNQQTGWDGTFKNKPLDNGVFVYVLHAVELDGTVVDKKGNVSLIR